MHMSIYLSTFLFCLNNLGESVRSGKSDCWQDWLRLLEEGGINWVIFSLFFNQDGVLDLLHW